MNDSKQKVMLPIILIPTLIVIIIAGYLIKLNINYNNGFKNSISEKDILKYLHKKYDGDFEILEVVDSYSYDNPELNCDGSTCDSPLDIEYDNKFYHTYSIYSDYYDTDFLVTTKKQIFSANSYGLACELPQEEITDNMENEIIAKNTIEVINKNLSGYNNYTVEKYYNDNYNVSSDSIICIEVKLEDNLDINYYYKLLEIKKRLYENIRKSEITYQRILFTFNNITVRFEYRDDDGTEGNMSIWDDKIIYITDEEFMKYIGE